MIKRLVKILIGAIIICGISGCENTSNKLNEEEETSFQESECLLPEGCSSIIAIESNSKNLIIGAELKENIFAIYTSDNHGNTWNELYRSPTEMQDFYCQEGTLSSTGEFVCRMFNNNSEDENGSTYIFNQNGQYRKIAFDTSEEETLSALQINEYGIFGVGSTGVIYLFDKESGKVIRKYVEEGKENIEDIVIDYQVMEKNITVVYADRVINFQIETGKASDVNSELETFILNEGAKSEGYIPMLSAFANTNDLCYINVNGIYRYYENEKKFKELVPGASNEFGKINARLLGACILDKENIMIAMSDSSDICHLFRYSKEKINAENKKKNIKVYALENSVVLRQIITAFRDQNPEVGIEVEIGWTGEDGVTKENAVQTLNTELASGDGPDILLMDGLPDNVYTNKGMLEPIGDLLEGENEDSKIFNLIEGEKQEYIVPSQFWLIGCAGNKDLVETVESIDVFVENLKGTRAQYPEKIIIDRWRVAEGARALYYKNLSQIIDNVGNVDKSELGKFYTSLKQIYDISSYDWTVELDGEDVQSNFKEASEAGILSGIVGMKAQKHSVMMGTIKGTDDLRGMLSYCKEDSEYQYLLLQDSKGLICIPHMLFSVNANSKEKEISKEFVKFAFSEMGQQIAYLNGEGFPVNISIFKKSLTSSDAVLATMVEEENESGEKIGLSLDLLDENTADKLVEQIKEAHIVSGVNTIIWDAIMGKADDYINGKIELEQAVEEAWILLQKNKF